jgi:hypothetical protein
MVGGDWDLKLVQISIWVIQRFGNLESEWSGGIGIWNLFKSQFGWSNSSAILNLNSRGGLGFENMFKSQFGWSNGLAILNPNGRGELGFETCSNLNGESNGSAILNLNGRGILGFKTCSNLNMGNPTVQQSWIWTVEEGGGCHNPIFTLGIFSDVDTQNEAVRTEPTWSDEGSPHQNDLKTRSGAHFPKFDQVWLGFTKFNQGLTKFDQGLTEPIWLDRDPSLQKNLGTGPPNTFPRVRRGLTDFDQVWPRFDRSIDQTESRTGLTAPWPMCRTCWELRFDTLRVKNGRETRELWAKQPIWEAVFARKFFPPRNDLVRNLKPLSKKVTSATTRNSRIVKSSSGQAGILIRKWPLGIRNIPTASVRKIISCEPKFASVQGLYF